MSTVQEITQAQITSTSTASESARTDIMGKEDFLTLLVAQLQNQDPLNPDEPTEFTAQLSQFSQLEQLFNLNDSMKNLAAANANSDKFSTLQTIGKYVVYQDSKFTYSGEGEIEVGYQLDGEASEITLSIQKDGQTVATLNGTELSEGNHFLKWDGLDDNGNPVGEGSYTVVVNAKATEGGSVAASPLIKSLVTGVDLTGEFGGKLLTEAGEVSFNTILGVYEAEDLEEEDDDDDSEQRLAQNSSHSSSQSTETNPATGEVAVNNADTLQIKDDGQISFNRQVL